MLTPLCQMLNTIFSLVCRCRTLYLLNAAIYRMTSGVFHAPRHEINEAQAMGTTYASVRVNSKHTDESNTT